MDRQALVKKWTPSPLTLILLGLIAWLWFRPPAEVSDENLATPPWQVTLTDGRVLTSEMLKGKVVLVNFWATSCPGCIKEMPDLVKTWQKYHSRGLETIAVAMSYDPPEYVLQFAEKNGLPFIVAPDAGGAVAQAFGNVRVTPTTFVIDKQGQIIQQYVGEPDFTQLHTLIESAL